MNKWRPKMDDRTLMVVVLFLWAASFKLIGLLMNLMKKGW